MQYEQIRLNDNFRLCIESTIMSDNVLRMGIKLTPYQNTGVQSYVTGFRVAAKQFSFLELSSVLSLVYNKSGQHKIIYDSYNIEQASTKIRSLNLENPSNTYSPFKKMKFDGSSKVDKFYYIINLLLGIARHYA